MTDKERAAIILKSLDKYIQIDWSFEDYYIKAIIEGLKEIRQKEKQQIIQATANQLPLSNVF